MEAFCDMLLIAADIHTDRSITITPHKGVLISLVKGVYTPEFKSVIHLRQ